MKLVQIHREMEMVKERTARIEVENERMEKIPKKKKKKKVEEEGNES